MSVRAADYDAGPRLDRNTHARRGRYRAPLISDQIASNPPRRDLGAARRSLILPPSQPHSSDVAQAGLFIDLLQTELDEVQALIDTIEAHAQPSDQRLPLLRTRTSELRHLLHALTKRFPAA